MRLPHLPQPAPRQAVTWEDLPGGTLGSVTSRLASSLLVPNDPREPAVAAMEMGEHGGSLAGSAASPRTIRRYSIVVPSQLEKGCQLQPTSTCYTKDS